MSLALLGLVTVVSVLAAIMSRRTTPLVALIALPTIAALVGADLIQGEVTRYELPHLGALNFVVERPPGGGVTETLALDPHGKSLSSALLELEIT